MRSEIGQCLFGSNVEFSPASLVDTNFQFDANGHHHENAGHFYVEHHHHDNSGYSDAGQHSHHDSGYSGGGDVGSGSDFGSGGDFGGGDY